MEMLLTPDQVAERLQISTFTVRAQLRSGALRGVRRGRLWRIPESAIMESTPARQVENESPLGRALEMVKARDAALGEVKMRTLGVDDVVTEIRQMREAQTP